MDKSFNDQELSDIMKEIEALEEDFKKEEDGTTASPAMEELGHLNDEAVKPTQESPVLSFESKKTSSPSKSSATSMSFKVHGELNLELLFDIGGKTVGLEVSHQGLTIQMDGGMTFNVPLADAYKKAI